MGLSHLGTLAGVPKGSTILHGIAVVDYLDENGEHGFAYTPFGEGEHSATIGILSMVIHDLMHDADPWEDG